MPAILLIKTSSLGDVVHNLPVASDISAAHPEAHIDWVVEEAFSAIPRMHPAVRHVIPVALRRWRRALWHKSTWDEIGDFMSRVRERPYDAVIDTQGLLKSALISRAATGFRHGLDWSSSREPLALFYDRTYRVPWAQHAVERNRSLAAQAMGYVVAPQVIYGVSAGRSGYAWLPPQPYVVLLHATSAERKLWRDTDWIELGNIQAARGSCCVLPWGNADERARSAQLAVAIRGAIVPPRLTLDEAARLLGGARAVAGVDTGLTHLAAALGVPTMGIYCATHPAATGLYGCMRAMNLGSAGNPPAVEDVVAALDDLLAQVRDSPPLAQSAERNAG